MGRRSPSRSDTLRILCVITTMGCGGAERRLAWMVNQLSEKGHSVALRVLHDRASHFDVDGQVDMRFFGDDHQRVRTAPARFWKRCRWLRRQTVEYGPGVVLSFIDVANVMTLAATRRLEVPVVVTEQGFPPLSRIPWYYRILRNRFYRCADAIVVQTPEAAAWAKEVAPGLPVSVFPNPVTAPRDDPTIAAGVALPHGPRIAALGRLVVEKGFDLLIEAFSRTAFDHPEWTLVIMGEGPERPRLERQIDAAGLAGRVRLLGQITNPDAVLKMCDMFVMSSRQEGFPNALCEAMACGLAPVSFDCPAGPRNIIRDGVDGVLVPPDDVSALASQLSRLISDDELRRGLALRAVEVVTRFDSEKDLDSWQQLVGDVIAEAGGAAD